MTDLNAMLLFVQVIDTGSFAKAARNLRMPTSTLSRRIADLEQQLQVRLIDRSTRSLKLTAVGEEILQQARRIADLTETVEDVAAQHTSKISGTLRLSAPPSISDSLLIPMLRAFQAQHPEVSVQVSISERVLDPVSDELDLAFEVQPEKEADSHGKVLLSYRHVLVCSPSYARNHRLPERPGNLLQHKLLTFSFWRRRKTWTFESVETGALETVSFEPHLSINEYSGLIAGLTDGIGIGEVPPIVRPEALREGQLVPILPGWQFKPMQLRLNNPRRRHVSPHARAFQRFAPEFVATLFPAFASRP